MTAPEAVPAESDAVTLAPGTEDTGLAMMLAWLIRQNLEQNPGKKADFERLKMCISIEALDAEVTVTLEFDNGSLVVHAGLWGVPAVRLSADAETVIELSTVRITRGIPNLFNAVGRRLVAKMLTRRIRISGFLRHARQLVRMTKLLSVND